MFDIDDLSTWLLIASKRVDFYHTHEFPRGALCQFPNKGGTSASSEVSKQFDSLAG